MLLQNQHYTIHCDVLTQPPLDGFDVVHNTENTDTTDFYMARTFEITRTDGRTLQIALLDLLCSGGEHYAVLDGNTLTIILFDAIVRLDPDTGAILQHVPCENMGGLYELHPIEGGYLIYGESDLFRYDLSLRKGWEFSGRDILVNTEKERSFWIEGSEIHLRDFLGWHYVLDFDGNLLREFQETT